MKTAKKTLLFDMDGTTYNFHERLAEKIAGEPRLPEEFRKQMSDTANRTQMKIWKLFGDDPVVHKEIERIIHGLYRNREFFASLQPYPGIVETLKSLQREYHVHICTKPSVVPFGSESVKVDTIIRDFGGKWREQILLMHDKTMARGDILFDDTWRVQEGDFVPERKLLLIDHAYNRQYTDVQRVYLDQQEQWPSIIAETLAQ